MTRRSLGLRRLREFRRLGSEERMTERRVAARGELAMLATEAAQRLLLVPVQLIHRPLRWHVRAAAIDAEAAMRLETPGYETAALMEFEGRAICLGGAATHLESPLLAGAQFEGRADCLGRAAIRAVACRL